MTPQQESEKHLLLISYYQLRKDSKQAAAQIEELLNQQPDNIGALSLKANLLAEQGKHLEALEFSDRGLQAFIEKYPEAQEPPVDLVRRHHALLDQWLRQAPIAVAAHEPARHRPELRWRQAVGPPQPASGRSGAPLPIGAVPRPLAEKDLSLLVELKIAPAAIVSKIQAAGVAMEVDEAVIARLKTAGAPETVLTVLGEALAAKTKPAAGPALTYENVLRLLSLGVDEQAILRRHAKSPAVPSFDAGQTAKLKQAGASDNLLAVLSADAPRGKVAGEPAATENAAGAGRMIPGWGEFIDPVGDCRISEQDGKVTIAVPGRVPRPLAREGQSQRTAGPRRRRRRFHRRGESGECHSGRAGERDWRRLGDGVSRRHAGDLAGRQELRAAGPHGHAQSRPRDHGVLPACVPGRRARGGTGPDRRRQADVPAVIARTGDRLKAAYSQDNGRTWQEFPQQPLDLPAKVKVGVSALNGTNRENAVQFEGLKITQ